MKSSIITTLAGLFLGGIAMAQISVPDRLIVQHRIGGDGAAASRLFRAHGASERSRLDALRVSVLTVDPARRDEIQKALEESGLFEFVEPDYLAHVTNTPNDPLYTDQWHLPQIQAPSAWNFTTGSTAVPIAIIDSGVDPTHPDIAPKISGGWNFLTNSATITDTMGHGTQTAGTAAAIGNSVGVAGVSWLSPIMPLIVVDSTELRVAEYRSDRTAARYCAAYRRNIRLAGAGSADVLQRRPAGARGIWHRSFARRKRRELMLRFNLPDAGARCVAQRFQQCVAVLVKLRTLSVGGRARGQYLHNRVRRWIYQR